MANQYIPNSFWFRRLHSLAGVGFLLFLMEHLLTNSEAALFIGEDGSGFIKMVNFIHSLPYLPVVELTLVGLPIAIHALLGIRYLLTSKVNSWGSDGTKPSLPEYARNHRYTWQRITSWILLIGIALHVYQMRFHEYPTELHYGTSKVFMVNIDLDDGLYTVADRLGVKLYDRAAIQERERLLNLHGVDIAGNDVFEADIIPVAIDTQRKQILEQHQQLAYFADFVRALKDKPLHTGEVIAVADNFGTAALLVMRDTFKEPIFLVLYTLFVLSATYHAFNGLWTFLITWGIALTPRSQRWASRVSAMLMLTFAFFGLAAVWGTYWINLKS